MDNYGTFNQRREHFKRIQGVTWTDSKGRTHFIDTMDSQYVRNVITKLHADALNAGAYLEDHYHNGRTARWWVDLFRDELAFREGTVGRVVTEPAVTEQQNQVSELCDRLMAHVASPCGRDLIFQLRSIAGAAGVTRYGARCPDGFASDRCERAANIH